MTPHRIAFIAGLHRSGTSLLFQCLREHPEVSGFFNTGVPEDEGQHLQTVYTRASRLGGPGRFGFSHRAHLTDASKLATRENASKLFGEWRPYWDLSKPWLVEKTPQNLLQTRFLQALFPDSRFIVMQRHPVAVSYATQRWSRTSLYSLVQHWLRCHEIFENDRPHLKHVLVIQYEDLVSHPAATLENVYRFLELDPRPPKLRIRDANEKYMRRWQAASRGLVSRYYIASLTSRFESQVAPFGYDLPPGEAGLSPRSIVSVVSAMYRGSSWIRHFGFRTYKQIKRWVHDIRGGQRKRRSAVDTSPLPAPHVSSPSL